MLADRFPLAPALAEVRNELAVVADVPLKLAEAVGHLLRRRRTESNLGKSKQWSYLFTALGLPTEEIVRLYGWRWNLETNFAPCSGR
jgi:hypothetical protein